MSPEKIAEGKDESAQQVALFCWASKPQTREQYPGLRWLHHIPNGGARGDSARSAAIVGARLKAEGVKPGVCDLFLPVPRRLSALDSTLWAPHTGVPLWDESSNRPCFDGWLAGLYIEMKRPGAINDTSKEQKEFIEFARQNGYAVVVCDSYAMARYYIEQYLGGKQSANF